MQSLLIKDLGQLEYMAARSFQEKLLRLKQYSQLADTLLLVEHPHVFTIGLGGQSKKPAGSWGGARSFYRPGRRHHLSWSRPARGLSPGGPQIHCPKESPHLPSQSRENACPNTYGIWYLGHKTPSLDGGLDWRQENRLHWHRRAQGDHVSWGSLEREFRSHLLQTDCPLWSPMG